MNQLLDVKKLTVSFSSSEGKFDAVKNLSFSLYEGETIGIVGESGSGKSTTALAIMGLLNQANSNYSGFISYSNDKNELIKQKELSLENLKTLRGKEIAMIFQNPASSLNPVMKCGKQVMEPIMLHIGLSASDAKEKCLFLFEEAGLKDPERIAQAYPFELSGGQIQRVMIAMAMSCNPKLIIADEPTTALDVTVQAKILELLNNLKKKHQMSMIFISHDMAVVSQVADRVLVMKEGELVEEGKALQVFSTPNHVYTKALLNCRPPLNKRFEELPTVEAYELSPDYKSSEVSSEERRKRLELIYSKPPILEVKNLDVSYQKRNGILSLKREKLHVIKDISFKLFEGETLGLVGESGSGKTTLGKALLRLVHSDSGEINFQGKNWLTLSDKTLKEHRKEMQMVFQDPYSSFNPRKTIAESLLEPMRLHKILKTDKQRLLFASTMLNKVNIQSDSLRKYPSGFSGGQIQRIGIARALLLSPSCIVFDESVSSLDVSVQAMVLNLINEIKRELKLSCIFISHDLSVVRYMSDRIMVLHDGKVVETGDADDLFNQPNHPYTKMLLDAIPKARFNSNES